MNFPDDVQRLFWEFDPRTIDEVGHADFIINRIMERGGWSSMIWLQKTYSKNRLVSFLEKTGREKLPPRELNYWSLITGIPTSKRKQWIKEANNRNSVWSNRHSSQLENTEKLF